MRVLFLRIAVLLVPTAATGQQRRCATGLDSLRWADSGGHKIVTIQVVKEGRIDQPGWNNSIVAWYSLQGKDSTVEIARIKEAAGLLENICYAPKTVRLLSLNKDSLAGAYFFYEVEKDGLDDNTLKLICFYKTGKIVVAGNVAKQSERAGLINCHTKGMEAVPEWMAKQLVAMWNAEARKRARGYIVKWE